MTSGIKKFCWGGWRIVTCILLGILSILVWLWRCACRWIGRHPDIALGGFVVIAAAVWLLTFVTMRHRAVSAEDQRDHVTYEYQHFREQHGYE